MCPPPYPRKLCNFIKTLFHLESEFISITCSLSLSLLFSSLPLFHLFLFLSLPPFFELSLSPLHLFLYPLSTSHPSLLLTSTFFPPSHFLFELNVKNTYQYTMSIFRSPRHFSYLEGFFTSLRVTIPSTYNHNSMNFQKYIF